MYTSRYQLALTSGFMLCLSYGCATTGRTPQRYTTRYLSDGQEAAVFEAAEIELINQGFAIESADRASGTLLAYPMYLDRDEARAIRTSRLSSRERLRKMVQIHVVGKGDSVSVYCQVTVEEHATEAHRMFVLDRAGSDDPGATPIDREAATTKKQNTVWRTVRRDKETERAIVDAILRNVEKP